MIRKALIGVLAGASVLAGVTVAPAGEAAEPVTFEHISDWNLPGGAAEIVAATWDGRTLAVSGAEADEVAVVDISDVLNPAGRCTVDTSAYGEPTSVALHPWIGAGLIVAKDDPNPGTLIAFRLSNCDVLWTMETGIGPDSVIIDRFGRYAAIAIEDEETEYESPYECLPENVRPGSVQLVRLNLSLLGVGQASMRTVPIDLSGVAGVNCPGDPQPEGMAFSGNFLYVVLQENNAIINVDVQRGRVTSARALGTTTHLADVVDDDVDGVDDAFTGRREPDQIAAHPFGTYLFTADEGDTDNTAGELSGGRTMSVVHAATLEVVADTGALVEQTADANGELNSSRQDNRGPEPEGITAFRVGKASRVQAFAAVTLERYDAVIIFDVTRPTSPVVAGYVFTGDRPEGIVHLPMRGLLVTANEDDGSLSFICVNEGQGCPGKK